jgi:hypothetical protein
MRKITAILVVSVLSLVSSTSFGITWVQGHVRDPVSGNRVKVAQPASSGSYIYQYPEKSDQVFWPYTDENWLWFNPKSGYIAFGGDFEELEAPKAQELKAWLKANYDRKNPPQTRLELLDWAGRVYTIRSMNGDFWCHFYRLMAFETRSDSSLSLGYVRKALPLLVARLQSTSEPAPRMETLYLLSEYNRRLGSESDAALYLSELAEFHAASDLAEFKKYLLNIADEQRTGKAAPQ